MEKTSEEVTSWKWKLDSEENDVIACYAELGRLSHNDKDTRIPKLHY